MKNNEEQHIQIKPRTLNIQVNFTFLFLFQTTMFLQEKLKDDEERRIFTLKCLEVKEKWSSGWNCWKFAGDFWISFAKMAQEMSSSQKVA